MAADFAWASIYIYIYIRQIAPGARCKRCTCLCLLNGHLLLTLFGRLIYVDRYICVIWQQKTNRFAWQRTNWHGPWSQHPENWRAGERKRLIRGSSSLGPWAGLGLGLARVWDQGLFRWRGKGEPLAACLFASLTLYSPREPPTFVWATFLACNLYIFCILRLYFAGYQNKNYVAEYVEGKG